MILVASYTDMSDIWCSWDAGWFEWYTETPIQIQQEFWSFLCYELLLSASLPLLYIKASVRLLLVLENLSPANQNGLHLFSQTGAGLELWLCYTLLNCSDRLHAHCSMSLSMLSKLEQIMIFCVLHIFFSKYLSEAQAVLTQ